MNGHLKLNTKSGPVAIFGAIHTGADLEQYGVSGYTGTVLTERISDRIDYCAFTLRKGTEFPKNLYENDVPFGECK